MNFTLVKGKDFEEHFDFKNSEGKTIALPQGQFRVVLEHGAFAREYTVQNRGLVKSRSRVVWRVAGTDSNDFEFTVMYYTLYLNDEEITRGIVRVQ